MSQPILDYSNTESRLRRLLQSRRLKRTAAYLCVLLTCYVGSYISMSVCGTFEPEVIGSNGVKSYLWAPAGFVKNYKYRDVLYWIYAPLWLADRATWHRDDDANGAKYPVHVPSSIDEVRKAWK